MMSLPVVTGEQMIGVALLGVASLMVWRGLRGGAARPAPGVLPGTRSGFTRWLTPLAQPAVSIPRSAASAAPVRVPEVKPLKQAKPARVAAATVAARRVQKLASSGTEAREIARKTCMSRDAVTMMMAQGRVDIRATARDARGKGTRFQAFVR
jgi:hypothetical protein